MLLMQAIFLSFFLASLGSFSLLSHPVSCCYLILVGSLSCGAYLYFFSSFSWYVVLFFLVYVGGVYVLFVYASLFSPNLFGGLGYSFYVFLILFFLSFLFLLSGAIGEVFFSENSHYLCNWSDGLSYCFFSFVLLLGFSVISVVSSCKNFFFR